MPKIKVKGQTIQQEEHQQAHKQTDRQALPNALSPFYGVDDDYPLIDSRSMFFYPLKLFLQGKHTQNTITKFDFIPYNRISRINQINRLNQINRINRTLTSCD